MGAITFSQWSTWLALDPPEPTAVEAALRTLCEVGAIVEKYRSVLELHSTFPSDVRGSGASGQQWKVLPLGFTWPRCQQACVYMVLLMARLQCATPVATIAAALSANLRFLAPMDRRTEARMARKEFSVDKQALNAVRSSVHRACL